MEKKSNDDRISKRKLWEKSKLKMSLLNLANIAISQCYPPSKQTVDFSLSIFHS